MNNEDSNEKTESTEKFLKTTFHSKGQIDVESSNITVFDLWALSSYLKMRADEMYVGMQTQQKMQQAAMHKIATLPDLKMRQ